MPDDLILDREKLRELRINLGLSQRELGRRCGVSSPQLSQYESGQRQPEPAPLKAIADAFGIKPMDLLIRKQRNHAAA